MLLGRDLQYTSQEVVKAAGGVLFYFCFRRSGLFFVLNKIINVIVLLPVLLHTLCVHLKLLNIKKRNVVKFRFIIDK